MVRSLADRTFQLSGAHHRWAAGCRNAAREDHGRRTAEVDVGARHGRVEGVEARARFRRPVQKNHRGTGPALSPEVYQY